MWVCNLFARCVPRYIHFLVYLPQDMSNIGTCGCVTSLQDVYQGTSISWYTCHRICLTLVGVYPSQDVYQGTCLAEYFLVYACTLFTRCVPRYTPHRPDTWYYLWCDLINPLWFWALRIIVLRRGETPLFGLSSSNRRSRWTGTNSSHYQTCVY